MPRYLVVIDLAVEQNDEEKKLMLDERMLKGEHKILEGKPMIFEFQDLTSSVTSELSALSRNKAFRGTAEVCKRMNVVIPVEIFILGLNKHIQRFALALGDCSDLQPKFQTITFQDTIAEHKDL